VSGDRPLAPLTAALLTRYSCPAVSSGGAACSAYAAPNGSFAKDPVGIAHCEWANTPPVGRTFTGWVGTYNDVPNCNGYYNESTMRLVANSACPSGYTNNAGVCNLADSALVDLPSNNYITSQRSGNVHFLTNNDADNIDAASGPLAISASGGVVAGGNVTGGGAFTVTTGSDGKTVIEVSKDLGNGSTQKWQINVGAPDGSGVTKVEGTGSGVYAGTGNLTSGSPAGQTELASGLGGAGAIALQDRRNGYK